MKLLLALLLFVTPLYGSQPMIHLRIHSERLHDVDDRLFGQFLERASWGESGPESCVDPETGELPGRAVQMLKNMNIPIVRFPGGTDIDYIDWQDMISNVPGRSPERPVTIGNKGHEITNRFGVDEYFRLRDQVGWESILVTNWLDAISKKVPLEEAALHAAGLVAYANAPVGAQLPDGMPDWPSVRAKNGHPEPFGAEYLQIGNEWYGFTQKAMDGAGLDTRESAAAWYRECMLAYLDAVHAVDPDIKIIIEGQVSARNPDDDPPSAEAFIERSLISDPEIKGRLHAIAIHTYAPGAMGTISRDGEPVDHASMTTEDWWKTWVAMPGEYGDSGECTGLGDRDAFAREQGVSVGCTEWNWNGWRYEEIDPRPECGWKLAAGLGAAGYIHGLMRGGDSVKLACQSMLLGHGWGITAIRVDPSGEAEPYYFPQGHATMFYSNHHGRHRLRTEITGIPCFEQPYTLGYNPPKESVAWVDIVVTATDDRLFIHAINRHLTDSFDVAADLSDFRLTDGPAEHHLYTGNPDAPSDPRTERQVTSITSSDVQVQGTTVNLKLPVHSASIFEISMRQ